jgi:hypothetical protein
MDISSNPAIASSVQPLEPSKVKPTDQDSLESLVKVNRGEAKYTIAEWEPYSRLAGEAQIGITSASEKMRELYTGVQNDILKKAPDLMEKDWDFSVDSKGELVIIEGRDKLSDIEQMTLKGILEDNGMDDAMNKLADHIVNWGVGMRGPEEIADFGGLERFDVNRENFKDIIFGRELMLNMKIDSDAKLTDKQMIEHAGTASRSRLAQWNAIGSYNEGKQPAANLISSQIMMRAEARF